MTNELEQELRLNAIQVAEIKKDIEYIKGSQARLEKQLMDFIDSAPEKFASKIVEKIVYTIAGVLLTGIIATAVTQSTGIKLF